MITDLHGGSLYWPTTLQYTPVYPPLESDRQADAVIVGGGMSGLICGYVLASSGMSAMVVDKGAIADGSTSANTGLLQFSNDIMLADLIDQIGEKDALLFYRACRTAVEHFALIAGRLAEDVGFKRRSSLYYASSEQHIPRLKREYETLRRHGFDVEWWSAERIAARFPFAKPGAVVTHGDAEINPYRFIHLLAKEAVKSGLAIHEHTEMASLEALPNGNRLVRMKSGRAVEAKHVVVAVGYEPEELRGKLIKANLNRSFVAVTEPQNDLSPWHQRFLLWETARPYLYMRTTDDNRVMIGGLDEEEGHPVEGRSSLRRRTEKLCGLLRTFFPALDAPLAYEWSGTFGESCDNLPFIGEDPLRQGIYYLLGYGGNGTVYSMLGAHLLRDLMLGGGHPLASVVGLSRVTLTKDKGR